MIKENKKWIFLFLLALIWGSSFILIKKSLIGLSPMQLGSLRIIITGFILFIAGFNSLKNLSKNAIKWIALSGFLGTFFPAFLFAYAETEIDSAIASILNSIVPINTILFGFLAFNIISTKRQIIGVLIGFTGAILLISNGAAINPNQNYWYALLVIIATVMYAFNINIIKRHLQEYTTTYDCGWKFYSNNCTSIFSFNLFGLFYTTGITGAQFFYLDLLCFFIVFVWHCHSKSIIQ